MARTVLPRRLRKRLTPNRGLVCDIVRMATKMPRVGLLSDLEIGALAEVRRQISPKLAWNVILMKAYAQIAERHPELRQIYVPFPWPHIYQHDRNVCMMTVNRVVGGEQCLFFARFEQPESKSLVELQRQYDQVREAPIEQIKQFRHQLRFARCPWYLRRLGYWIMRNVWVRKAASHMGTFGMTLSSFRDTYGTVHLGPNTTTLGVDPISRGGKSRTLLTFDHRLIDGKPAVDLMDDLGRQLRGPILAEMQRLAVAVRQSEPIMKSDAMQWDAA